MIPETSRLVFSKLAMMQPEGRLQPKRACPIRRSEQKGSASLLLVLSRTGALTNSTIRTAGILSTCSFYK